MGEVSTIERPLTPVAEARLQLENMEPQFKAALPAHIPPERFSRVVMTAIQNNSALLNCDRRSLWNAAMRAAQDGLLPDGRDGAIVEYKGKAQWMPMIGGIRKKARNSGEIATWEAYCVYANDEFAFELGDEPFLKHRPALTNRGAIIAAYSIATLKDGSKSREVMSIEDVELVRGKSHAKNGPWNDPVFYPEMVRKTVARRHSKVLPMSSDLDDLIRSDDDLYDLNAAPATDAAPTTRSKRTLADKLDGIAKLPGPAKDEGAPPQAATVESGVTVEGGGPIKAGDTITIEVVSRDPRDDDGIPAGLRRGPDNKPPKTTTTKETLLSAIAKLNTLDECGKWLDSIQHEIEALPEADYMAVSRTFVAKQAFLRRQEKDKA